MVKESRNAADVKAYLEAYPAGRLRRCGAAAPERARARLRRAAAAAGPFPAEARAGRPLAAALTAARRHPARSDRRLRHPRGAGAALQPELRDRPDQRPADRRDPQGDPRVAVQYRAHADGRHDHGRARHAAQGPAPDHLGRAGLRRARARARWCGSASRARRRQRRAQRLPRPQPGQADCKVVSAPNTACGALGFYMAGDSWGAYAVVRADARQATGDALNQCRQQARRPDACGVRITFCADGSHQQ